MVRDEPVVTHDQSGGGFLDPDGVLALLSAALIGSYWHSFEIQVTIVLNIVTCVLVHFARVLVCVSVFILPHLFPSSLIIYFSHPCRIPLQPPSNFSSPSLDYEGTCVSLLFVSFFLLLLLIYSAGKKAFAA